MTSSHALSGKSSRRRCAKNSGRRSARFRVQTITEILGRGVVSAVAALGPATENASRDVVMCQNGGVLVRSPNPSSVGSSSAASAYQPSVDAFASAWLTLAASQKGGSRLRALRQRLRQATSVLLHGDVPGPPLPPQADRVVTADLRYKETQFLYR